MQGRFAMRSWATPCLHPVVCAISGKEITLQWTAFFTDMWKMTSSTTIRMTSLRPTSMQCLTKQNQKCAELSAYSTKGNAMKKIYSVPARYIFEGTFKVEAENSEEAKEKILKHCGMVMGSGIQTTLPDSEIDWIFCNHPNKQLGTISREK